MKDGLPISQTAVDSLGWIKKLYVDEDNNVIPGLEKEWQTIQDHYMFNKQGVLAQELRGRFWIAHEGEHPQSPFNSSPAGVIPLTITWRVFAGFFDWLLSFTPWGAGKAAYEGYREGGLEGALAGAGSSMTHGLVSKKMMGKIVKSGEGVVDVVDAAGQAVAPIAAFAGPEATAALAALHAGRRALHGENMSEILKEAAMSSVPIPGGAGGLLKGVGGKGIAGALEHAVEKTAASKGITSAVEGAVGGKSGLLDAAKGALKDAARDTVAQAKQAAVDQVNQTMANAQQAAISKATAKEPQAQVGGARKEHLSTEAQVMGAAVVALIAGGSLKGLVDYLMTE